MAIIKRRDRFVLFRLSKDEYEALRALCEQRDAASISSFARSEILKVLEQNNSSGVSEQLSSLQQSVQRIIQILEEIPERATRPNQSPRRLRS